MNPRQLLESNILGRVLLYESDAVRACDVISPVNFSDPTLKNIFTIIHQRAGKYPTDPVTISIEYHRRHNTSIASLITNMINSVMSHNDIWYQCLQLLETDIREKLTDIFLRMERKYTKNQNLELAAAMKQCRDHMANMSHDIFESVDAVYGYAKSYLKDEYQEIEEMVLSIPKRASQVRRQSRTAMLIDTLEQLSETNSNRSTLRILKDAFLITLQSKTVPAHILEASHHIEKNLYAN
jgi:replicative DNA helicase